MAKPQIAAMRFIVSVAGDLTPEQDGAIFWMGIASQIGGLIDDLDGTLSAKQRHFLIGVGALAHRQSQRALPGGGVA